MNKNPLLTNKITALYIGDIDLRTGKWFPIKKVTWKGTRDNNYRDLSVAFVEGAKQIKALYPNSNYVFLDKIGTIRNYRDIYYGPLRKRLSFSRPLEKKWRLLYGFDLDEEVDPIEYAAISGAYHHGDRNSLFPEVAPDEHGNYNFIFCSGESWYFSSKNRPEIEAIPLEAKITLQTAQEKCKIEQGEWKECTAPPEAIRIKMFAEGQLVGYAPSYIQDLYRQFGEQLHVVICRKNLSAAFDDQFLFRAAINQSSGIPFSDKKYQIFTLDSKQ